MMLSCIAVLSVVTVTYATESADSIGQISRLSRHEKFFLMHVAENNNAEVLASALAASKASDPEVKQYAALMVENQAGKAEELRQLAARNMVELPTVPSKLQQQILARLGKLDGAKFDGEYCRQIAVLAHKDSIALFKQAVKRAKNADVQAFAVKNQAEAEAYLSQGEALKVIIDKKTKPFRKMLNIAPAANIQK
ncbi:DUF4142 domain-containing protein [Glaciimonas soli]|nr:DUF4142 domain-containing protein [Glaciimonas soli]